MSRRQARFIEWLCHINFIDGEIRRRAISLYVAEKMKTCLVYYALIALLSLVTPVLDEVINS